MPNVTLIFGLILAALGPIGWFGADPDHRSFTAFTPTAIGLLLIVCGVLAMKESRLKHAMHAAATFGLLGFFLGAGRMAMVLAKPEVEFGWAATMVTTMAVVCAVFVGLCVKSFIDVRKAREKTPES